MSSPTGSALRIGSGAHKFLETWYENQGLPKAERTEQALESARQVIYNPPKGTPRIESVDKQLANQVTRMGEQYIRHWGDKDLVMLKTEKEGEAPLGNGHTVYFRVDGIAAWRGQVWFVEHKTSYTLGERFIQSLHSMHQLVSYTYSVNWKLKMKLAGALVNILRKPTKHDPEAAFWREPVVVTRGHIKNMLDSFTYIAEDITYRRQHTQQMADEQYGGDLMAVPPVDWPQFTGNCGRCAFYDICWLGTPVEKWQWRDEPRTAYATQVQPSEGGSQSPVAGSEEAGVPSKAEMESMGEDGRPQGEGPLANEIPGSAPSGEETQ